MPVNYKFSLGSDSPVWQWLPFAHNLLPNYHGFDTAYDGKRYIYYVVQVGTTAVTASTTQLWRFDTWGHGHQYLAATTAGNRGASVAYDYVRNLVILNHGAGTTSWQAFNLNNTSVVVSNVTLPAWALTTVTPVLPAVADYGTTLETVDVSSIPQFIESSTVTAAGTTTTVVDSSEQSAFMDGMIYLQLRFTSGSLNGQKRFVASVTDANSLTLNTALASTPSPGDAYVIELPQGTSSGSNTTTTLNDTAVAWTVNAYSNSDVVIVSGTGAGQRRRIASNTATTLTLSAAVTGNTNTGPWSVTPDATSVYKIQPSSDFMYYQAGALTGMYKIDLATGANATTWTTLTVVPAATNGGANLMWNSHAPFVLTQLRGNASSTVYMYNIGLNTWSTLTTYWGVETITTGAASCFWRGQRKIVIHKEGTNRLYALNLATRQLEPLAFAPYAVPGLYDGKRARVIQTSDGADWLYFFRAGGAEFFRVPLEWKTLT